MKKIIRLTALSDKGKVELSKDRGEEATKKEKKGIQLGDIILGVKENIVSKDPLIVEAVIKKPGICGKRFFDKIIETAIVPQVHLQLQETGLEFNKDYSLEVADYE